MAATNNIKDFVYEVSEDGITITKYVGQNKNVVIPDEIDGKTVISIGEEAFANWNYESDGKESNSPIVNIKIPDTVTGIGYHAFFGCHNLESITLPDGITEIADGTFEGCENLKEVAIPESVTSIGGCAFSRCQSLENITLPKGITEIADGTFWGCENIKEIAIPENVTSIGEVAFWKCINLESINITIPESVTYIGCGAFDSCVNLESIKLSESVNIDENAFAGCDKLIITTIETDEQQQDMGDMEPKL